MIWGDMSPYAACAPTHSFWAVLRSGSCLQPCRGLGMRGGRNLRMALGLCQCKLACRGGVRSGRKEKILEAP